MSEQAKIKPKQYEFDNTVQSTVQLAINQCNYQIACGLGVATDVAADLLNAGVPMYDVNILGGLVHFKCGDASALPDIKIIGRIERVGLKTTRALYLGCTLEWEAHV
jgi:hypothetical protein